MDSAFNKLAHAMPAACFKAEVALESFYCVLGRPTSPMSSAVAVGRAPPSSEAAKGVMI